MNSSNSCSNEAPVSNGITRGCWNALRAIAIQPFLHRCALFCFFFSMVLTPSSAASSVQADTAGVDTSVVVSAPAHADTADTSAWHTPTADTSAVDSTVSDAATLERVLESKELLKRIVFSSSPFDTVFSDEFLLRHAFSFDHFFEGVAGFVLGRKGPIGADVFLSRYGMGGGRSEVVMMGFPINDPQNDIAPLALVPTTTVQNLVLNDKSSGALLGRAGLEGSVEILEREPSPDQPYTAIELSKGRFDLRQRRIRFASARSNLGIDLGYDELLNDGYPYDARNIVGDEDFGRSFSRFHTLNVRGILPNEESYVFSFRWFENAFQGNLVDPLSEQRRNGHFAAASTSHRQWRFSLFQRSYDVSMPDSHTVNHTTAAYAKVRPQMDKRFDVEIGLGLENIESRQGVSGAEARHTLRRGSLGGKAAIGLSNKACASLEFALGHHLRGRTGWGGQASFCLKPSGSHELSASVGRSFRLPNLGERFLPLHAASPGSIDWIVGNRYLAPETSWEAGVRIRSVFGFLEMETRVTEFRIQDEIVFAPVSKNGETWLIADNGESRRIGFIEERCVARLLFQGAVIRLAGGLVYAFGKREGFFKPVPETRLDAILSIDRDFFKASSSLALAAEYQYSSSRQASPAEDSPPYSVFNLKLDARLLDAHLYLLWLNVFDERYQTLGSFLMTPRTLVYGIQWVIYH